jgi:branched-subunit amino acid transport protein
MSAGWIVIGVVGVATVLFKAAGPVFIGGRELPPRALGLVEVLAPAMLAALVVTQLVGGNRELVLDGPRLLGVAVAGLAIWLRAPLIAVIVVAGAVAGLARLLT